MFEHSVKVPRHFKVASTILQKVIKDSCSLKTLLFADNKYKHFRVDVLYALISEAVKHNTDLDEIFTKTNILTLNPRLDPWLAKILAVELIYGKKTLPGKSKPELTVQSYKDEFLKHIDIPTYKTEEETLKKARPRFIRVNTNLLTTSDAIRQFQDDGYRFVRCTSKSYSEYLKQLENLDQYEFIQDFHVKSVFAFSPRTKFFNHPFYLENKIVLQNKATTLAVHLLAPPPGSVVLDMCAAPGMKATHVAAFMRNQGKVYAVERNEERYKTLCDFVEKTGSTCIQPMLADVLTIRRGQLDDVEYILLDPSCSGSGMDCSLHNYQESVRIARLTSLQEKLLKHAMSAFPKVKRIVYSTCSLYPEENERVVANTVSNCRVTWSVLNAKELLNNEWNNFGSGLYGFMGVRCLYARPESDYTTGFFVAVLEKTGDRHKDSIKKRTENEHSVLNYDSYERDDGSDYNKSENLFGKKKRKKLNKTKGHESVAVCEKETDFESTVNSEGDCENILDEFILEKNIKKKSRKDQVLIDDLTVQENITLVDEESNNKFVEGSKKKKRKKEKIEENYEISEMHTKEITNELIPEKKRKKHKKEKELNNEQYSENVSKENESHTATIHTEGIDFDNEITDNNEIRKKKKRKKDKTESDVVLDTSKDKESKKNKNNLESVELICDRQVLSETVLDEMPVKKKKKKNDKEKIATR